MENRSVVLGTIGCRTAWQLLVLLLVSGCAGVPSGEFPGRQPVEGKGRTFVVWLLSDIQPPTTADRRFFEQAIADVNEGVEQVDMGYYRHPRSVEK